MGEESTAIGTATVSYNADGSFLLALDMGGLTSDGTAAIAESCDGEEFGDWDGETNYYNALGEGISKSAFRYTTGYSAEETHGKSVVVYDDAGSVIGCGALGTEKEDKVLVATMGRYPNYEGDIEAAGMVTVTYTSGDSFVFQYMLSGLEANCEGCGIHIHAGTSCETHELVKGHGWNSVVVQDLWTAAGGATYNTDASGSSMGFFNMFNGYGYEENYQHAVVIHGQDGTRMGCGILM